MQRRDEEAIVLDAEAVGEADRRVLLLTAGGELLRVLAPAAARSRRRFGAALQPGARVRARWTRRTDEALAILEEATLLAAPPTPDPLERYYVAAHLLEVAALFAREGAEDPRMFRLLSAALARLGEGAAAEPIARYVEVWTMRLAGLLPPLDECAQCGTPLSGRAVRIAGERGVFCAADAPAGARLLGSGAAAFVEATRLRGLDDVPPLAGDAAGELARVLPALIMDFTERPLRAWTALQRLRRTGT